MSAPQPPPSAGHRLTHIPELLEKILLYLNDGDFNHLKSLLLSQLVSRQFHATIQASPNLSRALFLSPTPGKFYDMYSHNPFFQIRSWMSRGNVILPRIKGWDHLIEANVDCTTTGREMDGTDDVWVTFRTFDPDDEVRFLGREGSWRRMVLMDCEYCVTAVRVQKTSSASAKYVFRGNWENPTLGGLFDVAFPKPRDG